MTYISLATAKQLEAWGCVNEFETEFTWYKKDLTDEWFIEKTYCNPNYTKVEIGVMYEVLKAYDLRDIICNGEMAKAFFGEDMDMFYVDALVRRLHIGEQENAEKILLDNCVFNPENK